MTIGVPILPTPASAEPEDMLRWANSLVEALTAAFAGIASPEGAYTVTGLPAEVRTLDCSGAATTTQVARVLGTVIGDLQTAGVLTT
jgi:hypothetical protein